MEFPLELKYSKEHIWIRVLEDHKAIIGITEFAQNELGEIIYVDLPNVGSRFNKDEVFGSVEALKTTSDLFMPVSGDVLEKNEIIINKAELVNTACYTEGWMIKIKIKETTEIEMLLNNEAYKNLVD